MAILKYIISPLAILVLSGCTKIFDPEISGTPVLCMNSIIEAGEPFEVELTHTWVYSELPKNIHVDDAVVRLYVNDKFIENLEHDSDKYVSTYSPESGETVRLVAESSTYGKAEATVTVPTPPEYSIGDFRFKVLDKFALEIEPDIANGYAKFILSLPITLSDTDTEKNYFAFSFNMFPTADYETFDRQPVYLSCYSNDYLYDPIFTERISVIDTMSGEVEDYGIPLFTDSKFREEDYLLNLRLSDCNLRINDADMNSIYDTGIEISVSSLSPELYAFYIYRWNGSDELVDLGLAEENHAYSNVSTNAGIVGAISTKRHTISLTEYTTPIIQNPS